MGSELEYATANGCRSRTDFLTESSKLIWPKNFTSRLKYFLHAFSWPDQPFDHVHYVPD